MKDRAADLGSRRRAPIARTHIDRSTRSNKSTRFVRSFGRRRAPAHHTPNVDRKMVCHSNNRAARHSITPPPPRLPYSPTSQHTPIHLFQPPTKPCRSPFSLSPDGVRAFYWFSRRQGPVPLSKEPRALWASNRVCEAAVRHKKQEQHLANLRNVRMQHAKNITKRTALHSNHPSTSLHTHTHTGQADD